MNDGRTGDSAVRCVYLIIICTRFEFIEADIFIHLIEIIGHCIGINGFTGHTAALFCEYADIYAGNDGVRRFEHTTNNHIAALCQR